MLGRSHQNPHREHPAVIFSHFKSNLLFCGGALYPAAELQHVWSDTNTDWNDRAF